MDDVRWLPVYAVVVAGGIIVSIYKAHIGGGIDWRRVTAYVALNAIQFGLLALAFLAPADVRHIAWGALYLLLGSAAIVFRDEMARDLSRPIFASRQPGSQARLRSTLTAVVGALFVVLGIALILGLLNSG